MVEVCVCELCKFEEACFGEEVELCEGEGEDG